MRLAGVCYLVAFGLVIHALTLTEEGEAITEVAIAALFMFVGTLLTI